MKRRILFVMLAIMLILSMVPVAMAQDIDPCFGLSADDCAAIDAASLATIDEVTAFNSNFSIDFSLTGIPDGDVTFNLTGSGPMAMAAGDVPINMDLDMDVSWTGPDGDGSATIGFMIVDGIAYVDAGDGQWMGVDIIAALSDPSIAANLPVDPADLASGDLGDLGVPPEALGAVMTGVPALFSVPETISYTRSGDVFSFDMDIAAILASPEFGSMMTSIGEAAGEEGAMVGMAGALIPLAVESANINVTQTVGGGYVTGLSFGADALINPAALGEEEMGPISMDLLFDVTLSDVNGMFEFAAPEGAQMMPMGS